MNQRSSTPITTQAPNAGTFSALKGGGGLICDFLAMFASVTETRYISRGINAIHLVVPWVPFLLETCMFHLTMSIIHLGGMVRDGFSRITYVASHVRTYICFLQTDATDTDHQHQRHFN